MQKDVLRLKQNLEGINGLALDIDETLCWTVGFWMQNLQRLFGNPENLTVEEMVKKYRYTQNVPYWQTKEAKLWMMKSILDNELQKELPIIEGASKYVTLINKRFPIIAYISTRPSSVLAGTKLWLEKYSFPKAPIILKPPEVEKVDGNKWKAMVLSYLDDEVICMIDDNIGLVESLIDTYTGKIILFGHERKPESNLDVEVAQSWEDIHEMIEKLC